MQVQKLRLRRGWSQQQVADLSGVSVRTIQRIERGETASIETLKSLASVFEIDFTELLPADTPAPAPEPAMTVDPLTPPPATAAAPMSPAAPADARRSAEERLAMRHVRRIRGFYSAVVGYLAVLALLLTLNLLTRPGHLWVVWPALGMGLALAIRAFRIWGPARFFGPEWERRQVEKRLGRPL